MRITFFSKVYLSITLTLFLACGSGSDKANTPPIATEKTLPKILEGAIDQGIDGIFVYIQQGNNAPISIAAGIQNRATQQLANPQTLFKIASISKLFIAVAASKLIDNSTVNLDDTLNNWLPEIGARIENAETITLQLLLQHRSGIPDFDSQFGFSWENEHADINETLEYALDLPADFAPDSRYQYSNTNYLLIGKILDKALGFSHREYITDNILSPLQISDTYLLFSDMEPERLSKGYWNNIERSNQDYVIPGGSMISTVKDISIFLTALNKGTLLSTDEQAIYNSVYFLNHSGWLPGYQSIAQYQSNIDTTVIQFINTTGGNSESVASATFNEILDSL